MKRLLLAAATMLLLSGCTTTDKTEQTATATIAPAAASAATEEKPLSEQVADANAKLSAHTDAIMAKRADEQALALLNDDDQFTLVGRLQGLLQILPKCPTASLNSANISKAFDNVRITNPDDQLRVFEYAKRKADKDENPFKDATPEQGCNGAATGFGVNGKLIPGLLDFN